jgi:hypothetical protein
MSAKTRPSNEPSSARNARIVTREGVNVGSELNEIRVEETTQRATGVQADIGPRRQLNWLEIAAVKAGAH